MPINQVPSLLHRPKKLIFPIQLMKYMCFPILRKLVGYILKSVRFREELFQETLILKKQGKKSFFDSGEVLDRFWNDFFARKTFSELHGLENRLELNLDELSKEVASRFFYSRYIAQLNGILSFSATGYLEPLKPYYPLDAEEQERLIRLGKTFQLKYDLPKHLIISNTQTVTAFGMSYFPAQIQKTLEGRDVIDGGSFAGDSAMIFTEYCPRMVYAFEPNPYTYVEMQNILDLNKGKLGTSGDKGGGGVTAVPMALGGKNGTMNLYTRGAFDGATSFHPFVTDEKMYTHAIKVTSIDNFAKDMDIGLIKLDIEGAESEVIEGALETIKKHKPLLIISIYHTPKDFFEIKPILENLNLGYKFMIRHLLPTSTYHEYSLLAYSE